MPPGRDNIPLDHPRRIARIAFSPAHTLANETPEVQRLCADYRAGKRPPTIHAIQSVPDVPRDVAAKIKLISEADWTEADWEDLDRAQRIVRHNIAARHGLLQNAVVSHAASEPRPLDPSQPVGTTRPR